MSCRTRRFTGQLARMLASLLLLGALGATACAKDALSPEQALDLYLKTFINKDLQSAAALNDYLEPAYKGPAVEIERVGKMDEYVLELLTKGFMQEGPGRTFPELKQSASDYFKAMQAALRRSKCRATESALEDNEWVENSRIAQVRFVCNIPSVQFDASALELPKKLKKADQQKLQQAFSRLTEQLNNAPLGKEVTDTFRLYETKVDGKSYWHNGSPGDLLDVVMGGLTQ
jgi:hypothetical protein